MMTDVNLDDENVKIVGGGQAESAGEDTEAEAL